MPIFLRCMREDLEIQLREGRLHDKTPDNAQLAIYGIQIFEDSLLYGTAFATEDGKILFFDDIYGHDKTLATLLER